MKSWLSIKRNHMLTDDSITDDLRHIATSYSSALGRERSVRYARFTFIGKKFKSNSRPEFNCHYLSLVRGQNPLSPSPASYYTIIPKRLLAIRRMGCVRFLFCLFYLREPWIAFGKELSLLRSSRPGTFLIKKRYPICQFNDLVTVIKTQSLS